MLGFDLSLTGAAACAMPIDWAERRDWSELRVIRSGQKLKKDATCEQHDERLVHVRGELRQFLVDLPGVIVAGYVEGYAFAQGASRGHALAELGGVVKLMFRELTGLSLQPVASNSARKLLCGKVPSERSSGMPVKDFVGEMLRRMGCPFEDDNLRDAVTIANWGVSEQGHAALIGATVD